MYRKIAHVDGISALRLKCYDFWDFVIFELCMFVNMCWCSKYGTTLKYKMIITARPISVCIHCTHASENILTQTHIHTYSVSVNYSSNRNSNQIICYLIFNSNIGLHQTIQIRQIKMGECEFAFSIVQLFIPNVCIVVLSHKDFFYTQNEMKNAWKSIETVQKYNFSTYFFLSLKIIWNFFITN